MTKNCKGSLLIKFKYAKRFLISLVSIKVFLETSSFIIKNKFPSLNLPRSLLQRTHTLTNKKPYQYQCFIIYQAFNPGYKSRGHKMAAVFWREKICRKQEWAQIRDKPLLLMDLRYTRRDTAMDNSCWHWLSALFMWRFDDFAMLKMLR